MGRALGVPQDPDIDENSRDNSRITPLAVVVHKTIGRYTGPDSGDSQYIENHELAHYSIGEDQGEWEQILDDEVFAAHCNGANRKAVGLEFSDLDPHGEITDWQVFAMSELADDFEVRLGIPKLYLDPDSAPFASVLVDNGGYWGWISHYNVMPWSGIQHHDRIPMASWTKAMQLAGLEPQPAVSPKEDELEMVVGPLFGQKGNVAILMVAGKSLLYWDASEGHNQFGVPVGASDYLTQNSSGIPLRALVNDGYGVNAMIMKALKEGDTSKLEEYVANA